MAERLRRRQDDDRAARSTNASLRNHRNRQRVLALQKPRLNHCATPACPGGQTGPSRAPLRRTRGGHFAPRGALPFATGTSLNLRLQRGHDWTPIEGQVSAPIDMQALISTWLAACRSQFRCRRITVFGKYPGAALFRRLPWNKGHCHNAVLSPSDHKISLTSGTLNLRNSRTSDQLARGTVYILAELKGH